MNKLRTLIVLVGLSLTAACATEPEKILKPDATALTAPLRVGVSQDMVFGYRATKVTVSKNGTALDDVACTLEGTEFVTDLVASTTVNLPSFGPDSKPIRLTCAHDGEEVQKLYSAVNLSLKARKGNAAVTGILISPIVGAALAAEGGQVKSDDAFGYDDIELKF